MRSRPLHWPGMADGSELPDEGSELPGEGDELPGEGEIEQPGTPAA